MSCSFHHQTKPFTVFSLPVTNSSRYLRMDEDPIRFGIVGCAEIARKVSRSIILSPNSILYAIGSRSIEKAKQFAVKNGFPDSVQIYGSYEDVLDDIHVDAVYMPLPASLHLKWAVLAAEKKKHVLLEKPTALNVSDLDQILEACKSNGVQFMDATMWMHHPRTARMREILSDPQLFGQLKMVHCTSTYAAPKEFLENDIRVKPDLDSLGALGDAGWYCLRAMLWASDYRLPKTITALPAVNHNESGVILSCGASFHWGDDKVATFHCSFLANESMDLQIYGSNGRIQVGDFIIPYEETSASFAFSTGADFAELNIGWSKKPKEVRIPQQFPQEALMIQEFSMLVQKIRDCRLNPDPRWGEISRQTQLLVDAVKRSIEIGFKPVEL